MAENDTRGMGSPGECEGLIQLATQRWRAGEFVAAREMFCAAAALAEEQGASDLLARAALGLGAQPVALGFVDDKLVGLLERALAVLSPTHVSIQAELLAALANALYQAPCSQQRRLALTARAAELARDGGDAAVLGRVLALSYWALWDPANARDRLATAGEIRRLAQEAASKELTLEAHLLRLLAELELGNIKAADDCLDEYERLAHDLEHPTHIGGALLRRAMRALLAGQLAEGEQLMQQSLATAQRANDQNRIQSFGAQVWVLRCSQGRLAELEPAVKVFVEQYPSIKAWRAALAFVEAQLGHVDEARRVLDALAAGDFQDIPRDALWLSTMTSLAQASAALPGAPHGARLYALLRPFAYHNVGIGGGVACLGSVARYLGLLERALDWRDEAARDFDLALSENQRMGALAWLAYTQFEYGTWLLGHTDSDSYLRGRDLIDNALAASERLGMTGLTAAIHALDSSGDSSSAGQRANHAWLHQQSGHWVLTYTGETYRLKDSKGMQYIAALLRQPSKEVHVLDLAAGPAVGVSSLLAAQRRRWEALRDALAEAETFNDLGRIAEIKSALAAMAEKPGVLNDVEARGSAAAAERARVNVSRCIAEAVRRIAQVDGGLAHYLETTIRTGRVCSYRPSPRFPIRWEVSS